MVIKLIVSKEKNIERLNKLTDDPAFVVSLLKNMGYKEVPDSVAIKIGKMIKPNENEDENKNENE